MLANAQRNNKAIELDELNRHELRKREKAREKAVAHDEALERKRSAKTGFQNPSNPRRSWGLTIVTGIFAVYCLFPFVWLIINSCKTQADFVSTFGLGFGHTFALWDNIREVFTYQDGIFGRWFLNTILTCSSGRAARRCWPSWAATPWRSSTSRDARPCSPSSSARSPCRASRSRSRSSSSSPSWA